MNGPVTFRKRTTTDLLRDPHMQRHIAAEPVARAETVVLPPLTAGQHMFTRLTLGNEVPPDLHWDSSAYVSVQPWLLTFCDVLVQSEAGILCVGDAVVSDTLQQTAPQLQHYKHEPDGIRLATCDVPELTGTWLSLLGGNYANYYHWTLEGLGRLSATDTDVLARASGLLLPAKATPVQRDGVALTGLAEGRRVRSVASGERVRVERLLVPWSMTGYHRPHPLLRPYFAQLREAGMGPVEATPPRIYIDRRAADLRVGAHRRLLNEDEVVAGLASLGFVPVALEQMSLMQQIRLFAGAEAIVAPHGAGLANIVYARPGCRLVELHMDGWTNWCFRTLAAVFALQYDAVLGHMLPNDAADTTRRWTVPVLHTLAVIAHAP